MNVIMPPRALTEKEIAYVQHVEKMRSEGKTWQEIGIVYEKNENTVYARYRALKKRQLKVDEYEHKRHEHKICEK